MQLVMSTKCSLDTLVRIINHLKNVCTGNACMQQAHVSIMVVESALTSREHGAVLYLRTSCDNHDFAGAMLVQVSGEDQFLGVEGGLPFGMGSLQVGC